MSSKVLDGDGWEGRPPQSDKADPGSDTIETRTSSDATSRVTSYQPIICIHMSFLGSEVTFAGSLS